MNFLIVLLNLIFSLSAFAGVGRHQLALIYKGPGVCSNCSELAAKHMQKNGFKIKFVQPGELTDSNFLSASFYVQPGGSDNIEDTLKALSKKEIHALRRFVLNGGRFLGICAGAYMAGQFSDEDQKTLAFGFLPSIHVEEELEHAKGTLLKVRWGNLNRWIYAQSPPYFSEKLLHVKELQAFVVARYEDSGRISAIITKFGKGFVGLIGPHPEASHDWYIEDNLSTKYGFNSDLFDNFLAHFNRLASVQIRQKSGRH